MIRAMERFWIAVLFLFPITGLHAGTSEDIELLGSDTATSDEKNDAMDRIAEKGAEAYDDVLKGLSNEKESIRASCARLLGSIGDVRAVDALLERTSPAASEGQKGEASEIVRAACVQGLTRLINADTKRRIGEKLFERLKAENLSASETFVLASAIADTAYDGAFERMEQLLKPEGDPGLGACAARYMIKLDSSRGWNALVALCDAKKTEGEGDKAKEVWSYPKSWEPVRRIAVLALVKSKRSEGMRLLLAEIEDGERFEDVVMDELASAASGYGSGLVRALVDLLKNKEKNRAHNACHQLLAKLGAPAVEAMVALSREGLAVVAKAKEEGKDEPDPYKSIVGRALSDLEKDDAARRAMLDVYRNLGAGDTELRETLLNTLVSSSSPEARLAILDGLSSANIDFVKSAIDSWKRNLDGRDLDRLTPLASHGDKAIRLKLAETLAGSRFPERVRPLLMSLSRDTEDDIRTAVWQGLGKGQDQALIDEFERGLGDSSDAVKSAAARAFDTLITNLKLDEDKDDKEKKELRKRIVGIVRTYLAKNDGASLGIIEEYKEYHRTLFKDDDADGEEVTGMVKAAMTSSEARFRAAAAKLYRGRDFWDKDWTSALVQAFKSESDATAAEAQLGALGDKYKDLEDAQRKELVPLAVKWLGKDKADDKSAPPAKQAANLLGELGNADKGKCYAEVYEAVKGAVENAVRGGSGPEQVAVTANGIEVFTKMKAGGMVKLVIEAVEKVKDNDVERTAKKYLSDYATNADLPAIDALSTLNKSAKESIRREAEKRESRSN
ncbi:MAG: HEAT repeat domain-containing protein [Planctomycetes bacterium]|nr:HEAT repeat domain-containing protein [Planctomycetota bacterium]